MTKNLTHSTTTPIRVSLVGLGLIGGSILRRLAQIPSKYSVVGFDTSSDTRVAARSEGLEVAESESGAIAGADLVLVAVPPRTTGGVVGRVLELNTTAIVTDVASVKTPVVNLVRAMAPEQAERFLPSHPLAGAETAGWNSARDDLLDRAFWAVCPPVVPAGPDLLCRWSEVFSAFDARLIICEPEEHDVAVARTSHAPHLAAEMIAEALNRPTTALAASLSGGAFRDMTRIAQSDPNLWQEILDLNRKAVIEVIDEWMRHLDEMRTAIDRRDPLPLLTAWNRGNAVVELVTQMRWQEPTWEHQMFEWPAWDRLVELGRKGFAVRGVTSLAHAVSAEVTKPPVESHQCSARPTQLDRL